MASRKTWERFSVESLSEGTSDDRGRLFISPLGQVDLSGVRLLRAGVDTIRQLYSGECQPDVFDVIKEKYDSGFKQTMELGDITWLIGSGGASGYRYRLQNSDLGLICFFGSRYAEPDKTGSHLKIEVSPHYIDRRSVKEIAKHLYLVSRFFLDCPTPTGCAVHIALDLQGWEPPKDFESRFICRSKRRASFEGLDRVEFDNVSEISAIYGNRESFLFGSASALQFAMYRKDTEAKKRDKMHFWSNVWDRSSGGILSPETAYQPDLPVWRLELRYHQSVIQEFGMGIGEELLSFEAVSKHLTGLWRKGMDCYRLDSSRTYIDPAWQLFSEDVTVIQPDTGLIYKRARKAPGLGNEKNIALALGNLLTIYARNRFTAKQAMEYLKNSGMWWDLKEYFHNRMMGLEELHRFVEDGLNLRRLQGVAA